MPNQKPKLARKLLVATVGLATISYVACGSSESTTTNPPSDSGADITSGNLMPPDTGKADTGPDLGPDITSGNLAPPLDTGVDSSTDESDTRD